MFLSKASQASVGKENISAANLSSSLTTQLSAVPALQLMQEEEEPIQAKLSTLQKQPIEEEPVQGKFRVVQKKAADNSSSLTAFVPVQKKENNTGLPDNLKSGVETLSGFSMDDVKVHYNSAKPAQLNALAYAQGTDIHVASGQEKHLPHEAWHVVQQKQGRVQATMQMKEGIPVNDDAGLEKEADTMGDKAMAIPAQLNTGFSENSLKEKNSWPAAQAVQRKIGFEVEIANPYSMVKPVTRRTNIKGDSIMVGYGWNMTPDGGGSNWKHWWVEFISDAVDETTQPEALAHYADDLVVYINAIAARGKDETVGNTDYKRGDYRNYSIFLDPYNLYGQFQVTGAVKLSKLMDLLEDLIANGHMHKGVYGQSILDAKESSQKMSTSTDYNNLVALLGTYIAGQYDDDSSPSSAKHKIPVLSKTNLGEVFNSLQPRPKDFSQFVMDVIIASGQKLKEDAPLFAKGINGTTSRGIDQNPDITISEWLDGIFKGGDLKWADTEYKMEEVGVKKEKQESSKGLVIELRALVDKDHRGMPYKQWPDFARTIAKVFKHFNELKK